MALSSLENRRPAEDSFRSASFHSILGNDRAKHQLLNAVKSQQVSHAYPFEGAAGLGKHSLAAAFVKALFCEDFGKNRQDDACLSCPSCTLIENGNHPDVKWITLKGQSEDAKTIGTDRIREEVVQDMAILPYRSDKKVYIIEQAEKMTVGAQNALLKTIEEPPAYGMILLLTEASSSLLPTILSRCVKVNLEPLPKDLLIPALLSKGVSEEEAPTLALACGGSLGRALLLAHDEAFLSLREELYQFLSSLPTLSRLEVLRKESLFAAPSTNRDWLFLLLSLWYRDILLLMTTGEEERLLCRDYLKSLRDLTRYYSLEKVLSILSRLSQIEENLKRNANLPLAMDILLVTLCR